MRLIGLIVLVMALANTLYGYPLPLIFDSIPALIVSAVMLVGYVYLARTVIRLPLAVINARQRFRHARDVYRVGFTDALQDGWYRGMLNQRVWERGVLAIVERLVVVLVVWVACDPLLGAILVQVCGTLGMVLLIIIYIVSGQFGLLVRDGGGDAGRDANPFRHIPNLRIPEDR